MPMLLLDEIEILAGVAKIATEIKAKPSVIPDVVIPIMTGALFFCADLMRELFPDVNPIIAPIKLTRLPRLTLPGKFIVTAPHDWYKWIPEGLNGKRGLIVDTVYDTGATMSALVQMLSQRDTRSVYTAALIWKNLGDEAVGKPDYYGHDLKGKKQFLYGYGMDKDNRYRALRTVC